LVTNNFNELMAKSAGGQDSLIKYRNILLRYLKIFTWNNCF